MYVLDTFVKNEFTVYVWIYFCVLYSVSLVCVCVFLCQCRAFLVSTSLQYNFRSGNLIPLVLFFLLKTVLAFLGVLWFHINFRIFFLFLWRMSLVFWWGLHWIYRLLWVDEHFHNVKILILPIDEHRISLLFVCVSSSISYINVVLFLFIFPNMGCHQASMFTVFIVHFF